MKYIPIALLITILLIPAVILLNLQKEIGLKQENEGKVIFFYGHKDFKSSFVSPKANLKSIVLKLKNISIRNSKPVKFSLLDKLDIIRQIDISGSNIPDGDIVRFTFEEIKNSKNKKYTIILSSPESTENEELGIHTDTLDNPVIITYHVPTSKLELILNVYKNFVIKIGIDKIFIAMWIILFSVICFLLKSIRF